MKSKKTSSSRKRASHLKKAKAMKKVRPLAVTASLLNTGAAVTTSTNHENWIEIDSFSFGASNPTQTGASGGAGAGKVDLSDISLTPPKP
jgi:hypothetical protein